LVDVAKTRDGSIPWDKPVGDLITGRTATGVEGACEVDPIGWTETGVT